MLEFLKKIFCAAEPTPAPYKVEAAPAAKPANAAKPKVEKKPVVKAKTARKPKAPKA
jgi:hypothetical protein